MTEIILSIIIGAYNEERNIKRCLRSILDNTLSEIEVIVVDDGSTDETYNICTKIAEEDKRLQVIRKENGGVSSARNIGLKMAKGTYFAFVDGDDYVSPQMFEVMIDSLMQQNADICYCRTVRETLTGEEIWKTREYKRSLVTGRDNMLKLVLGRKHTVGMIACGKIAKRSIQEKNQIYFDEELHCGEDGVFWCRYHIFAERMTLINDCLYHYVEDGNNASVIKKLTPRQLTGLDAIEQVICLCDGMPRYLSYLAKARYHKGIGHMYVMAYIYNEGNKLPDILKRGIKKYRWEFYFSPEEYFRVKCYYFVILSLIKFRVNPKWILKLNNFKESIIKKRK